MSLPRNKTWFVKKGYTGTGRVEANFWCNNTLLLIKWKRRRKSQNHQRFSSISPRVLFVFDSFAWFPHIFYSYTYSLEQHTFIAVEFECDTYPSVRTLQWARCGYVVVRFPYCYFMWKNCCNLFVSYILVSHTKSTLKLQYTNKMYLPSDVPVQKTSARRKSSGWNTCTILCESRRKYGT